MVKEISVRYRGMTITASISGGTGWSKRSASACSALCWSATSVDAQWPGGENVGRKEGDSGDFEIVNCWRLAVGLLRWRVFSCMLVSSGKLPNATLRSTFNARYGMAGRWI